MSFDLIGDPISSIVSASILPNKFAGMMFLPAGRLRITFPMLEFAGRVLNAFWICARVVPTGQVIEAVLAPAGAPQVQGSNNAALEHGLV